MPLPQDALEPQGSLTSDFERVVRENHQKIFNFIFYLIGDREEAYDLTQETFVRAFVGFGDFRGESTVNTWLVRIARNLTINRLRQRQVERRIHWQPPASEEEGYEDWDPFPAPSKLGFRDRDDSDPLAILESKELRKLVRQSLDELPVEFREVILLRDMEGHSYLEMTEILGCSLEALKSRLFRARARLREQLRPHLFPEGDKR